MGSARRRSICTRPNGSYHGYHLTYSPTLNPNADAGSSRSSARRCCPPSARRCSTRTTSAPTTTATSLRRRDGPRESAHVDPDNPGDTIWRTFDHRPRFGNNYVGLRNRIAILSEAYSYLDFGGRVGVTAAFVEEVWRTCAKQAQKILLLTSQADRALTTRTKLSKPLDLGVDFRIQPGAEPVAILVGDVSELAHPETGLPMRQMTELAEPVRMREYGTFVATRTRPLPNGWVIPRGLAASPRMAAALDRLRWHGIETRTIETATQMDVDRFVVQGLTRSEREFQGHQEARLSVSMEAAALSLDAGSVLIPANQRLARLAAYLLEPDSDDGLVTWGVIEDGLSVGQGYPIYRVR